MSNMHRLREQMAALHERIGELERRSDNMVRSGAVAEVDPAKQMVRLKVGLTSEGEDVLSPWVPYAQPSGASKLHMPPKVGQNMQIVAAGGNEEEGVAHNSTWSTADPSPGDSADPVFTHGAHKIAFAGGKLVITGPVTVVGDFVASGGVFTHEGKDVGKDHKHKDTMPGGGETGVPK